MYAVNNEYGQTSQVLLSKDNAGTCHPSPRQPVPARRVCRSWASGPAAEPNFLLQLILKSRRHTVRSRRLSWACLAPARPPLTQLMSQGQK